MSLILSILAFLGISLVVFVGGLLVWCFIAGLLHGVRIAVSYFWWIGALLFWVAVVAIPFLILF